MLPDLKTLMGVLSLGITLVAYGIYLWQTWKGYVEPHPFSWLFFGFTTATGFFVQLNQGAGAGSWVTGATAVFCFAIGCFSLFMKRWSFSRTDWIFLLAGVAVFALYLLQTNTILVIVLATTADLLGYLPTITKVWVTPHKDSLYSFGLNSAKYAVSLVALRAYSFVTVLFPAAMVVANAGIVLLLLARRRALAVTPIKHE